MKHWETPSRSSPQGGGTRGCLCRDNTYSRKCCDGSLRAQGIGNISRTEPVTYIVTQANDYLITQNEDKLITNGEY